MQITRNSYLTEALYNTYQKDPGRNMDEASFAEMVRSVTGETGHCVSPGAQLLWDYKDWKAAQPPRQLPSSKGATQENIAYLKEHFSGSLSLFQKVDALDTMVEMGILTEKEMLEAVMGPITLETVDKEKMVVAVPVGSARYMPQWDSFFTSGAFAQADGLEELFKILDRQLKDAEDKDAAEEIKEVLEQLSRRSCGASWGVA